MKAEWHTCLTEYKRQQNLRIEQIENKIKEECNKERDRQIELAIERLEKDSRDDRLTLQRNFDCKLRYITIEIDSVTMLQSRIYLLFFRSLTEKYEMDLQNAIDNEQLHKGKLTQTKDKLEKTQTQLQEAENKLQECVTELNTANEVGLFVNF